MKEQDSPDTPEESTEIEPEIDLDRGIMDIANGLNVDWDTVLPGDIDEGETEDPPPSEEDSE